MKPIFIVGVGRSGTTLLANLLGSHAELSPIYETPFLRSLLLLCEWIARCRGDGIRRRAAYLFFAPLWRRRFLFKCDKYREKCAEFRDLTMASRSVKERTPGIRQAYESFPFGDPYILFDLDRFLDRTEAFLGSLRISDNEPERIYALARIYVEDLFREHCERDGKPIWVNKTPRLLLCLDELFKLFPAARCIHIVRDGRDVVLSNLSLSWGPKNVRAAARRWRDRLKARNNVDRSRYSFLEVRYEDLIGSPRDTLARIFAFLGLSADIDAILARFELYDHRVGAWRAALDASSRKVFAKEAGDLLTELGYEKDQSWVT